MSGHGLLDLLDLGSTNALHLALANTVTVENDSLRRSAIVAFEGFDGACHARLQVRGTFLANLVLDHARGPIGCGRLIHRSGESQDRFLAKRCRVEHVHSTDHRRLIHERQLIHGPRCPTKLGIHLDQHFGDDRSQILASLNG